MRALQAQPTVSPTLIHHIQRNHIQIKPNIKVFSSQQIFIENLKLSIMFNSFQNISGSEVTFTNGEKEIFDSIIMCTGYKIDLNYLHPDLRKTVFKDSEQSILNVN